MTFQWTTPKQIVKFLSNTSAVTASPSEDSAIDDSKTPSPVPLSITTQTTTETTQASEENLISSVEVSPNTTTVSPLRDSVVTISQKRHRPNENVLEIAPNDSDINDHNKVPRPVKKRKKRCTWPKHVAKHLKDKLDEINWDIARISSELVEKAKEDENDPLHGYTFEQIKEKRKNLLGEIGREEGSAYIVNDKPLGNPPNDSDINDHHEIPRAKRPRPVKKRKKRCTWPKHVAKHLKDKLDEISWDIARISSELVEQAKEDQNDPLHGYTFEQIKEKRKNLLGEIGREEGSA